MNNFLAYSYDQSHLLASDIAKVTVRHVYLGCTDSVWIVARHVDPVALTHRVQQLRTDFGQATRFANLPTSNKDVWSRLE